MALVVEDGTGLVGAESYASLEDANAYHLKMGNDGWPQPPGGNEVRQEAMLRRSAAYLDNTYFLRMTGEKKNPDQGLAFPRTGAVDFQGEPLPDTVPKIYKDAQCEVALYMLQGLKLAPQVEAGARLKRKRVDVLEKEWFEGTEGEWPILGALDLLLVSLFGPRVDDNQIKIAKITRA